MGKHKSSLLVVPDPYQDETPASWIQRICQIHQCTYAALLNAFGIRPHEDPDLRLRPSTLARLAYRTTASVTDVKRLGRVFTFARRFASVRSELNYDAYGRPSYRYCPRCLSDDVHPYWRIAWRFQIWEICPIHYVDMQDQCPHCQAFIAPYRSNIGFDREAGSARTSLHCASCHMSLASGSMAPRSVEGDLRQKIELQMPFVSACLSGHFRLEGYDKPLLPDFLIFLKNRNMLNAVDKGSVAEVDAETDYQRTRQLTAYLLQQYRHEKKFKGNGRFSSRIVQTD